MNFKKILIVILIVIVIAILGSIVYSQINSNIDTEISFLSESNLKNGDNVTFQLKDSQGNVLANKNINITYVKDGEKRTFSVTTDSDGKGYLTLIDEEAGVRDVIVSFNGDDKYNPSTATQKINITEDTSESNTQASSTTTSSSSDSSSDSQLNYDSELNVHYDDNGVIHGGQNDGESYDNIKNNPPQVDEDGNLE